MKKPLRQRLSLRLTSAVAGLALLLSTLLLACSPTLSQSQLDDPTGASLDSLPETVPSGVGPVTYAGDVHALRIETYEDLDAAVVYRRVDELRAVLTAWKGRALLVYYREGQKNSDKVVALTEQLCESARNGVLILLARAGAADAYLKTLRLEGTPTVLTFENGQVQARYEGLNKEDETALRRFVEEGR